MCSAKDGTDCKLHQHNLKVSHKVCTYNVNVQIILASPSRAKGMKHKICGLIVAIKVALNLDMSETATKQNKTKQTKQNKTNKLTFN